MTVRKIDKMHLIFGELPYLTCGSCCHFSSHKGCYSKCRVYGITASEATDWSRYNTACGCHNRPYNDIPIVRYNLLRKKDETPTEGQISMELENI